MYDTYTTFSLSVTVPRTSSSNNINAGDNSE